MSHSSSRTYNSLRNSAVALAILVIELLLHFVSRKVFLDVLGTEVMGLNTTAASLLGFLNLAELGVGTAVTFSLYKPLQEKDLLSVNEIVSVQGWIYRRIAYIIIGGSSILMAFFPLIFSKIELPLWYAYASFGVLLFSSLLGYFINYNQIVLSANQQEYKIQGSYRTVMILKGVIQIILLKFLNNGYIWWLVSEFLFTIIASCFLQYTITRECPYLHTEVSEGKILREKYTTIYTKIRQVFFHKVATFVLEQSSNLIIYCFATLSCVALYGNYMVIIVGATALLNSAFNGVAAGVGSLVAEGRKDRIMQVFRELFTSRFLMVGAVAFSIYVLGDSFISLWLGTEYKLDKITLLLIVITFFINTQRSVVDTFISAFGLFKDIWAPITEAAINIGLSVLLGHFFGLHGILAGVIISLLIIVLCWKPYFLFHEGFHTSTLVYVRMYASHMLALVVDIVITNILINMLAINPETGWSSFLMFAVISVASFSLILFGLLFLFEPGMRSFVRRFVSR